MRARTRALAVLLILAAALPACSAGPMPGNTAPSPDAAAVRRELEQTFTRMAVAWNAGDLSGHVAHYADSATMMIGRGPAGGRERIAEMLTGPRHPIAARKRAIRAAGRSVVAPG